MKIKIIFTSILLFNLCGCVNTYTNKLKIKDQNLNKAIVILGIDQIKENGLLFNDHYFISYAKFKSNDNSFGYSISSSKLYRVPIPKYIAFKIEKGEYTLRSHDAGESRTTCGFLCGIFNILDFCPLCYCYEIRSGGVYQSDWKKVGWGDVHISDKITNHIITNFTINENEILYIGNIGLANNRLTFVDKYDEAVSWFKKEYPHLAGKPVIKRLATIGEEGKNLLDKKEDAK